MKPFKIIDHLADIRLQIFGHTQEELFQNAALALAYVLSGFEKFKQPPLGFKKIKVEASNINILLINFLNEILTQSEINRKIYPKVKFLKFSPKNLEAQIFSHSIDEFREDVKAITYHEAEIKQNKRGIFEITLTFDI